jgi:hypothetical protein
MQRHCTVHTVVNIHAAHQAAVRLSGRSDGGASFALLSNILCQTKRVSQLSIWRRIYQGNIKRAHKLAQSSGRTTSGIPATHIPFLNSSVPQAFCTVYIEIICGLFFYSNIGDMKRWQLVYFKCIERLCRPKQLWIFRLQLYLSVKVSYS